MAFKKGNSREDKSTNAGGRTSRSDNSSSASRGSDRKSSGRPAGKAPFKSSSRNTSTDKRSTSAPRKFGEQGADRPFKRFESSEDGERKPFRTGGKPGFKKQDGEGGGFRGGDKPFNKSGDRPFRSGDKPFRSTDKPFRGGDKPFRSNDKPYGERQSRGNDKPYSDKPFRERPQREERPYRERQSREEYEAEKAPTRVMRGRKNAKPAEDNLIRLNRYISNAGICSRRKADELISAGVISVNGEVVSELGFKIDPSKDLVRYNGETLKRERMVYVLLNKPKDYITTTDDPQERRTVMHLVEKASRERIYPVGRLDRNTTGLLLMTNDGDLADKLSHPRNNITKLYQVELNKSLTQGDLNKIQFGLELEDGLIKPDNVSFVAGGSKKEVGIQIHSGKNRIVRRIFEHLGYEVVKLDRSIYANLTKKDLPRGRWRYLDEHEVIQLKHLIK